MTADTWPETNGIPVLLEAQSRIYWVRACLGEEARQIKAEGCLDKALAELEDAILALRENK